MPVELQPSYQYRSIIVRVIDGDTVEADVDLGFGFWMRSTPKNPVSFRLAGCNLREKHEPGGRQAREYVVSLLPAGTQVVLTSIVNDKYGGRYDARVNVAGVGDLAEHLIVEGWAAPWSGKGPRPVPPWPRVTRGLPWPST